MSASDRNGIAEPDPASGTTTRTGSIELVAWAIIAFGAVVRIRQYLGARSLRYDEARVAWEIAERSLPQMLDMEGFIRVAPPGWFVLEKLSMMAFGTGELSLRLVPLVAALIALPLFWIVPRRYLGERAALICLAFGAVSQEVVFYASELKQYSSDVTWCLLALLVVHPLFNEPTNRRPWLIAGIVGMAAFWFSQPAVFVFAAAGIVLLVHVLRTRSADLKHVVGLGAAWTASLALNYVFILRGQTGRGDLINYWRHGFPPLTNVPRAQLDWLNTRFYEFVETPAGFTSAGLLVFGIIVGFLALLRRQLSLAAIIALVAVFTLGASTLRLYPIDGRLMLFSVPLLLIVLAAGIDQLDKAGSSRFFKPGMLLLVLLIASPLVRAARMIVRTEGREEIKAAVNYAADRMNENDGLYLGQGSYGAYLWYSTWTEQLRNPADRTFVGADVGVGVDSIRAEIEHMRQYPRVWMVFVDYYPQDVAIVLGQIDPIAERRDEFSAPGALAYLYEFRNAVDSAMVNARSPRDGGVRPAPQPRSRPD